MSLSVVYRQETDQSDDVDVGYDDYWGGNDDDDFGFCTNWCNGDCEFNLADKHIYLFIYLYMFIPWTILYNHEFITIFSEFVQIEIDLQARDSNVGRLYALKNLFYYFPVRYICMPFHSSGTSVTPRFFILLTWLNIDFSKWQPHYDWRRIPKNFAWLIVYLMLFWSSPPYPWLFMKKVDVRLMMMTMTITMTMMTTTTTTTTMTMMIKYWLWIEIWVIFKQIRL